MAQAHEGGNHVDYTEVAKGIFEGRIPNGGEVKNPKPPVLVINNLHAWYGNRLAIAGVNLSIPQGDVTVIIGPSGCGKSTLIRSINRMHENIPGGRVTGSVSLAASDGTYENIYDPDIYPERVRRTIGMVFQKPNPFPLMSIQDNVLAGVRLEKKLSPSEADETAQRNLEKVGLWKEVKDILKTSGASLSGGQQQRLCIARSLAVEPQVLLMDEPTGSLDPIASLKIEELIINLRDECSVVVVTHNISQAARISDFVAYFQADENEVGRLVEAGPAHEVLTTPKDTRTEAYLTGRLS